MTQPDLERLYQGLMDSIYTAEEAINLIFSISDNSDSLNKYNEGKFFGRIQSFCIKISFISIGRIFSSSRSGQQASIGHISKYLGAFEIKNENPIREFLAARGCCFDGPISDTHGILVPELHKYIRSTILTKENCHELKRVMAERNKAIAHYDALNFGNYPRPSFADLRYCLKNAQEFIGMFSGAFKDIQQFWPNGEFIISDDTNLTAASLEHVLRDLYLVAPTNKQQFEVEERRRTSRRKDIISSLRD